MNKGFEIVEEAPDREYFTIIPNYIVNHSDIWEQGIYLIMKKIAGETGKCFATHQTIADKLKISRPTVSKTIVKLIARGWIKETGTIPGKTHPVKVYKIVDLWELNTKFYKEKKRKPQNVSLKEKKDTSTTERKKGSTIYIEEEQKVKKNQVILHSNGVAGTDINKLIILFKPINPSYERLYKIPTQRKCLENLVKKHGYEKIQRMLQQLPGIVSQPYAPVITTPYQLENKLGELVLFVNKHRNNKKGGTIVVK